MNDFQKRANAADARRKALLSREAEIGEEIAALQAEIGNKVAAGDSKLDELYARSTRLDHELAATRKGMKVVEEERRLAVASSDLAVAKLRQSREIPRRRRLEELKGKRLAECAAALNWVRVNPNNSIGAYLETLTAIEKEIVEVTAELVEINVAIAAVLAA